MEDLLLKTNRIRYNGKIVGRYGPVATMEKDLFIWRQQEFESYGGGFAMSEGLLEKLEEEDVGYVYISMEDALVTLDEIRESQCIDHWDEVFDGAEPRPQEPQYLVKP